MIKETPYYEAICDSCNEKLLIMEQFTAMNDKGAVEDAVSDSEWAKIEDGRTYCPDCYTSDWNETEDKLLAFTKDTQNGGAQLLGEMV